MMLLRSIINFFIEISNLTPNRRGEKKDVNLRKA